MSIRIAALSRLLLLVGLAAWMSIGVFNNITDPGTNQVLLGHMLSMDLLTADPQLGRGLAWHAWSVAWVPDLLNLVIGFELCVAGLLWLAALSFAWATLVNRSTSFRQAQLIAIIALSCFLFLWLWFACGGLWFGYWIKQGAVQMVHMTLILITLSSLLYIQSGLPTELGKSF